MIWSYSGTRTTNEALATVLVAVPGSSGIRVINALIDTGATHTCMDAAFAANQGIVPNGQKLLVALASGTLTADIADVVLTLIDPATNTTFVLETKVALVQNMSQELIIGMSDLTYFEISFDKNRNYHIKM